MPDAALPLRDRATAIGFCLRWRGIIPSERGRRPAGGTMPSSHRIRGTGIAMGEFTTLMARDGHEFNAWLAAPQRRRARRGGDRAGNLRREPAHPRAWPTAYAAEGYVTIAPCLFDRIRRGIELGYSENGNAGRPRLPPADPEGEDAARSHRLDQRDQTRGPRGGRGLLLGRHAGLSRRLRAAGGLRGVVLRRPDQGSSRQVAAAAGDVSLRREGSAHPAGRRGEDPRRGSERHLSPVSGRSRFQLRRARQLRRGQRARSRANARSHSSTRKWRRK